jgi:4-nitrophenyl phosphatase
MFKVKAVAFDLDGTIYLGDTLIKGVNEVLENLAKNQIKVFYFTNNSSKTRAGIHEKLLKLGVRTDIKSVYNSAYATGIFLRKNHFKRVFCMGSEGLKEEIGNADVICINEDDLNADAVIVGLDSKFDYNKLSAGINILKDGNCKLILCNRDRTFPVEKNRLMAGCGPLAAALEYACCREADFIIGKPETFMLEILCKDWNYSHEEVLVIGDTYESDILMAEKYGSPSIFIDPGKSRGISTSSVMDIKELIGMIGLKEDGCKSGDEIV